MRSTDVAEGVLDVRCVSKRFGGMAALSAVSLSARAGRVTALIGPNGAGKTTLFNVICGFIRPDSGSVWFENTELTTLAPHEVAAAGVGRLFQDARAFRRLSPLENALVALLDPISLQGGRMDEIAARERARSVLDLVGLGSKANLPAEQLSFGEQKLVSVARLLANRSRLVLLDEPSAGVAPHVLDRIGSVTRNLAHEGCHVLLIEHDMQVVLDWCDDAYLMDEGRVVASGPPRELLSSTTLSRTYVGA